MVAWVSATRDSMLNVFDFAWERLERRLEGLSDDEYFWEPVSGSWTVRRDRGSEWMCDGAGADGTSAQFTTLAWRLFHVAGLVLGGFGGWLTDGDSPYGRTCEVPGTAAKSQEFLASSYSLWRTGLSNLDDERLQSALGDLFGPYANDSVLDLSLHVLDEMVHHGAEVGLLRDLYAKGFEPRSLGLL